MDNMCPIIGNVFKFYVFDTREEPNENIGNTYPFHYLLFTIYPFHIVDSLYFMYMLLNINYL